MSPCSSASIRFVAYAAAPADPGGAAAERGARTPEPASADDWYADYTLAPYDPPVDPSGRLRSVNLLYESFADAGRLPWGLELVRTLRDALGPGSTVWGAKRAAGETSWELYFYNPYRSHPGVTIENVVRVLEPLVAVRVDVDPALAWHMFSIELTQREIDAGVIDRIHLYVNGSDRKGSSRCYELSDLGLRLENLYTFHDPAREMHEVLSRLASSVHLPAEPRHLASVLPAELVRCRRLCVSNKQRRDGVYFAGIESSQVGDFLERQAWPSGIREHLRARPGAFDHILWDVGVNYRWDRERAEVELEKSAVYATF